LIRAVITVGLLAIASDALAQAPEEIRLWPGKAPGSENWTVAEVPTTSPAQVSAGSGMTKRGLPVDSWSDRLLDWLVARMLR
jgi:hypothetical protein